MKRSIQHVADSVAALDSKTQEATIRDSNSVLSVRRNPFHSQIVREVERQKQSRFG